MGRGGLFAARLIINFGVTAFLWFGLSVIGGLALGGAEVMRAVGAEVQASGLWGAAVLALSTPALSGAMLAAAAVIVAGLLFLLVAVLALAEMEDRRLGR